MGEFYEQAQQPHRVRGLDGTTRKIKALTLLAGQRGTCERCGRVTVQSIRTTWRRGEDGKPEPCRIETWGCGGCGKLRVGR